ncbi:hypothetical protein Q3C19_17810 [Bacteroides sp. ET489]|uniref:hypothetical protein n=1 Tax=Bacteroides sp. ET489 TaxID=3057126 RepID=UPI002672CFD3|nr:hypothetical protein [Bacteroides sp. ET489]MDO3392306.1 hypothetical protein [Bacteroides sp. ET489]
MEIKKEQDGKWIFPGYGKFLVNASAKEDVDKLIALKVFVPLDSSNDQWDEITEEEKNRIISAQLVAKGQIASMNESITQQSSLITASINSFGLSNEKALEFKDMYPEFFADVVGKEFDEGYMFKYKTDEEEEYTLYKFRQKHTAQAQYPPSDNTSSLYEVVDVTHSGTKEDPIPYKQNMALEQGKYYVQYGVVYECYNAATPQPYDLSDLTAHVRVAE